MGLETAGFALAAIATGATIGKVSAEKEAAQADLSAINLQSKLSTLQYQQKNLQNLEVTQKMLSKQAVQLSARGVAFDSPSFNALQRDTLNTGAKNSANLSTEKSLTDQAFEIERKNVKSSLHSKLFGEAANFGFNITNFVEKLPKTEDL